MDPYRWSIYVPWDNAEALCKIAEDLFAFVYPPYKKYYKAWQG
jgi:hypothetical protein